MKPNMSQQVADVTADYPADAKAVFSKVRQLVLDVAKDTVGVDKTEETLKWGEPSYLAEGGSTVRMKWSDKNPEQFSLYFNCNSILVETFKELYLDEFEYDGNRAMSFSIDKPVPEDALKHCLSMAMQYHKLKKLPLMGN